ncbi:DUF2490 domain-containing protein [Lentiprolixibacter aurantiacus]|uniref:DUF2490 domain-containing protein n=1 Tax=Lentiprolixibacter aurantiacus TaxID=2993939 RepID=A0AAE3MIE2_9FLAO|nr:DUF2490 domain-containing protein [Lentiprolixibacter aurantiacus]MCX2718250.1 DUF2490 domain-containing protein [Lentiprolixibacter aurantiacus]
MFSIKKFLFLSGLLFVISSLWSQDDFVSYWQPGIAVNYKVAPGYEHNFSLTKRSFTYNDSNLQFDVRQLDLVHFSKWRLLDNQSVGLGIQYRFRKVFEPDSGNELRLTQQYNITFRPRTMRFGHRIRSEQRIFREQTIHRFRYRLALDRPLVGEKLDVGEPYIIGALESLISVGAGQRPEFDQRVGLNIGWLVSQKSKIQAGLEYRREDFTNTGADLLFLNTSLVLSL